MTDRVGSRPTPERTASSTEAPPFDPSEPLPRLRRELATGPDGLSAREAARRLAVHGPNEVRRRARSSFVRELVGQVIHPLALLLWAAAALAFVADLAVLGWAILAVVAVNAAFALLQERQAERAVETLARYLPEHALAVRDGQPHVVEARDLVPGDLILLEEGDKAPADAHVTEGGVEVDLSMLTGESVPVERIASAGILGAPLLEEPNLVFSGTTCVEGQARAIVFATGNQTELGRIAALSQRTRREASPLERQVKRVAWLIAGVATGMGVVFLVLGVAVGLPVTDSLTFAIGLLVANVPEGLLPTITLALAVGVRALARRGALVKRLSAVETLGSTSVICTDKTGTLTRNSMRLRALWTVDHGSEPGPWAEELARAGALCTTVTREADGELHGDPTEAALVAGAADHGAPLDLGRRDAGRRALFRFDPRLRLMSVVQGGETQGGETLGPMRVLVKGAPEAVLDRLLPGTGADPARAAAEELARQGMRVLAVAERDVPSGAEPPSRRQDAESGLALLGLVGLYDPPRPEVAEAVRRCHEAGIRVHVVTGDNGATAAAVAREVGIGVPRLHVVAASESLGDDELDLGTETLPALALGRERSEPGIMQRPPRPRHQGVISRDMLIRSWGYLGLTSSVLVMAGYFYVLWRAGWQPGDPTGTGSPMHHAYVTATTATFAGIVTCQVGTAFAARTDHAALRDIGVFTNPLLLAGIAFELAFTAALVYAPPLQHLFGTAALPPDVVLLVATFPVMVWGTDELRRARRRRQRTSALPGS
ncbi:HAD-IC family P-type ATPase [Streptomyces sp. NPDC046374]|uniref:cation-translocating P-type ATPase n=1 Tax=Streptomyces sp. NPDC046374 TaxID=3154917 RepID=UPI0033DA6FE0